MTTPITRATEPRTQKLSREDAARWYMGTPANPMVIGALLLFDERLPLEALEALARDKLVPHRRFRQHVVESGHWFARPSWCDDPAFELGEHVRGLGPAADAGALVALASERMSAPLPGGRSPWTLELVETEPRGSALIARFHHCLADGQSLVALLEELAGGLGGRVAVTSIGRRSPGAGRLRGLLSWLVGLLRFFTLTTDPVGFLRRAPSGRKRVAWSASISMESVKAIAHATGHHVAEVLLAAVAGALERRARARGRTPRFTRALLPVAVPQASARDDLGNHYASVFIRLPIAATEPRARLETIAREMDAVRRGGELRMAVGLLRLAGAAAPALERWAVRWWARRASLVVSSLPGPPAPVRVAGRPLRSLFVWAPAAASIGLSVTFFGYAGSLHLGVLADGAVIDRPEELIAGFRAALDELERGTRAVSP
jgi:hypothetical protein